MNTSHKKGFTLVETLVAITILMIAIAGPLTVAMKAYTASLDARNRTIATNLAQETMEFLNNIKDNVTGGVTNLYDSGSSKCILVSDIDHYCRVNDDVKGYEICSNDLSDCKLYKSVDASGWGYNYYSPNGHPLSGPITPFTSYYYITPLNDPNQVRATTVVTWNNGSITDDVTLTSVLTNQSR